MSLGSGTPGTSSDIQQRSPLTLQPPPFLQQSLPPAPGGLYCLPPVSTATFQGPSASPSMSLEPADNGDCTKMAFGVAITLPQTIAASPKLEGACMTSPTLGLKHLSLMDQMSGVEAFLQVRQLPDPHQGAKVIHADPKGAQRRHSSETFSSNCHHHQSFAYNLKPHNLVSVEHVSLDKHNNDSEILEKVMSHPHPQDRMCHQHHRLGSELWLSQRQHFSHAQRPPWFS